MIEEPAVEKRKRRRGPLAFLDRFKGDDWRRALILAEVLAPPVARRWTPRQKILGGDIDTTIPRR